MSESNHTTKWIIALCITAVFAVAGWSVTFTQALKARAYESIVQEAVSLKSIVTQHTTQIAVLGAEFISIEASLDRIEAQLVKHTER